MIRSGRMRDSVTIVEPTQALGERGQVLREDKVIARNVPCSIAGLYGQEFEQARQLFPTATSRVIMRTDSRYRLTTKHILLAGNRRLQIGYVDDRNNRHYELQILCGEEA